MPSALELYYQQKKEGKAVSPITKQRIATELLGGIPQLQKKHSPGFFFKLLDILDRPGNATRALLVGKLGGLKGLIPFAQVIEDLTGLNIALDKDERVTGEEVINKLFGQQTQRKGKIDPVDVFGLLVEIVADPLWLVGGPGLLTKAGRAKALVGAAKKTARTADTIAKLNKLAPTHLTTLRKAVHAAKAGTPITGLQSKKLGKALRHVYGSGMKPKLAKGWAAQAAAGERAVLQLGLPGYRVPVVKGEKVLAQASKYATKVKQSKVGELFLAHSRRVSDKYVNELSDIINLHGRSLPEAKYHRLVQEMDVLRVKLGKMSNEPEKVAAMLSDFVEKHWAGEAVDQAILNFKKRLAVKQAKNIAPLERKLAGTRKKMATQQRHIESKSRVRELPRPAAPVPGRRPFSRIGALRTTNREIRNHPLYREALARSQRESEDFLSTIGKIDFGADFGDVAQHIDNMDGRAAIWRYVARPGERGVPWDEIAQQAATRAGTEQISDVYQLIGKIDDALRTQRASYGGINEVVLESMEQGAGFDPFIELLLHKRTLLNAGASAEEVNEAIGKFALKNRGSTSPEQALKWVEDIMVGSRHVPTPQRIRRAFNRELQTWRGRQKIEKWKTKARVAVPATKKKILAKEAKSIRRKIGRHQRQALGFKRGGQEEYSFIQTAKAAKVKRGVEAEKLISDLPEATRKPFTEFAEHIKGKEKGFLEAEQAKFIPVSEAEDLVGYLHRMITPEARDFLTELKKSGKYQARMRSLSVRGGFQKRRHLYNMTRDEIDEFFKAMGFEGDTFFEPSALKSVMARGKASYRSTGAADSILESIQKFSKPAGEFAEDVIPIDMIIEKTGLRLTPAMKARFAGKAIPAEIGNALIQMDEVFRSSDALRGLSDLTTNVQRYLKGTFTMPFPAYHGRNFISNLFLNWIAGVKNPVSYKTATLLQKANHATHKIMKVQNLTWDDAVRQTKNLWPQVKTATGYIPGDDLYRLADEYGVVGRAYGMFGIEEMGQFGAGIATTKGEKLKKFAGAPMRGGGRFAKTVEDNARLAHFVEKMGMGIDPAGAARSTKRVLFDYGDLSQFEKKIMRDKLFFFYTFARKNLPLQIETLIQQPGKQALFSHLAGGTPLIQGEGQNFPNYWQERLNIPIGSKDGNKRVISGTGLPIEEAFGPMAAPGVGFFNRLSRGTSRAAARMSPLMVAPIELATQRHLYFDKQIKDWPEWAMQKTPYGRVYGTVQHARKSPDTPGSKVSGFLTGLRSKYYNPEKSEQYKLRSIAREYLEKQPKAKTYKRYYVPEGQKADETIDLALQVQ